MVEAALLNQWPDLQVEQKIIKTSGDEATSAKGADSPSTALPGAAGRKGLFTAEIENSLIAGDIDLAVHSAKDLPSTISGSTEIAAVLPRGFTDDVLVSLSRSDLKSLPNGGTIATGSVRRMHQLRSSRPDIGVIDLRGNVPTRLRKLIRHKWDGVILARAGLERLGLQPNDGTMLFEGTPLFIGFLPADVFVPAGGQGIIAMQTRGDDDSVKSLVAPINHMDTHLCLRAEREFLRLLEADCNQPVGVSAMVNGDAMTLRGQVFTSSASVARQAQVQGKSEEGHQLANELLRRINGQ